MILVLALHVVVAVVAAAAARRLGPKVFLVAALAPAGGLAACLALATGVLDGDPVTQRVEWVPELGIAIDLRLDGMALLMGTLITGVGVLVFAYSAWYFEARPGLPRLAATLVVFAGAMLGIVLSDNLLLLYVFWELTSITSYLLIGTDDEKGSARAAALQAVLVTGGGGLAMLAGFVLLGQAAGTYTLSEILADPPTGGAVGPALVLVLLGALTKSAQVPFHSWLPGAMAAPTPISAYLHSATMVKAGVYLIARFAPAFAAAHAFWRPTVVGIGVATMLVGALRALRADDLKLLLAFGTVSQLGFMVALVGAGHAALTFAGVAVIMAHAVFKGALFLIVGIIDHQAHSRDLRVLSGVGRRMPLTFAAAAAAVASMAGVPPLFGFVTKEAAFEGLLHDMGGWPLIGIVIGSVLTFAYGGRFLWGAFATKEVGHREAVGADAAPPAAGLVAPAALLAVIALGLGLVPAAASRLARAAASSLEGDIGEVALKLWHGVTPALAVSLVAMLVGVLLFLGRDTVERIQDRIPVTMSSQGAYEGALAAVNRVADRTTGTVQSGSLPVYLGVILTTVLVLPGWALVSGTSLPSEVRLAESPVQVAVALLVVVAAVATARAHRRFAAVLSLGGVGYGVAVLFMLQGAPDLALTQLLVETLAVVIFVIVLRHLPERFTPVTWRFGTRLRLVVASGIGAFVIVFGLVAAAARDVPPVSQEHLAQAEPEGGGRNVVNVILVDIRGLDTLGEITVLAVAGLGIASLVAARRGGEAVPDARR